MNEDCNFYQKVFILGMVSFLCFTCNYRLSTILPPKMKSLHATVFFLCCLLDNGFGWPVSANDSNSCYVHNKLLNRTFVLTWQDEFQSNFTKENCTGIFTLGIEVNDWKNFFNENWSEFSFYHWFDQFLICFHTFQKSFFSWSL